PPGLSRGSTCSFPLEEENVDGRDKPGHDDGRMACGVVSPPCATLALGGDGVRTHAELFAEPRVAREERGGGEIGLRAEGGLPPLPRSTGVWLWRWAEEAPERSFLAERDAAGGWRRISYRDAYQAALSIGEALLDRGLGPNQPVMVLSENSVDHGLLTLGALEAGVPVVPVSTAYSLISRDFAKLRTIT